MNAHQILQAFVDNAQRWASRRGYGVDFPAGGRNFVRICGDRGAVLYVKVRSAGQGFWGLTKNLVDSLSESEQRWAVVLLVQSPDTGFLLPEFDVQHGCETRWTLGRDGDYKLNAPKDVDQRNRFECVGECLERLVGQSEPPLKPSR